MATSTIKKSTARVDYSMTNVVSQSTPRYELYKIGNRVYLNVHSLWKASVAKDTWETWATIPADLVSDIGSANPSTLAAIVNGNTGNVAGTAMVEINKANHDLRVKSADALSAGPAAGYGLVFIIDWYNA